MTNPCYSYFDKQIQERNQIQTAPHTEIYTAFHSLWLKFTLVDTNREEVKHQLAVLEHETVDYVNKHEFGQAVDNFRKKLELLQPFHTGDSSSNKVKLKATNLSRTIYDQKMLLKNQNEEMKMLKVELNNAVERIIELESALSTPKLNESTCPQKTPLHPSMSLVVDSPQLAPHAFAREMQCHSLATDVNCLLLLEEPARYITAGSDSSVCIVEVGEGEQQRTRTLLSEGAMLCLDNIAAKSGFDWLLGGGGDQQCRLWNLESGKLKAVLTAHSGPVSGAKFYRE